MKASRCAFAIVLGMCMSLHLAAEPRPSTQPSTAEAKHFDLRCPMDARYARLVEMNAEAFYAGMLGDYFDRAWTKPLVIHYSRSQADTRRLLKRHKIVGSVGYGVYIPETHALYTHREMDGGGYSGWGTLFHEIVHAFTTVNHPKMPAWCDEGLACFLGEWAVIVRGKVTLGRPNPWREQVLRDMIKNGYKIDVPKFMRLSNRRFRADSRNYHVARALFYWLHHTGRLADYLKALKHKRYSPLTLSRTVGRSYAQINADLLAFIKKHCYCAAWYKEASRTRDPRKKKMLLEKSLAANPQYQPALLQLAFLHRAKRDYQACRKALKPILKDEHSAKSMWSLKLMGDTYFQQGDYASALPFYEKAVTYAAYDVQGYLMYYSLARCHDRMKEAERAREFYQKYLARNWRPKDSPRHVAYARKFLARTK